MQCSFKDCPSKGRTFEVSYAYPCIFCKAILYCTNDCRNKDWDRYHKSNCSALGGNVSMDTSGLDISGISDNQSKKKKTIDDYEIVNEKKSDLGKGAYGQVRLVREKTDPTKLYALKIINKTSLRAYASTDYLKREIKIQKKLDHPHIIKLFNTFEDKENVYLVLEYAENGNLFYYMRKKKKLTEKESFIYFFQTCISIDYLHKKGILHRDLKPENLLLDSSCNIKVCDFGWSAEDAGKRNTFCGTVDYMAPEMVMNKPHDYKIDIWSLGILLYELIHGFPPFRGKTNEEKFKQIIEKKIEFGNDITEDAKDLILSILKNNPADRPDFVKIFEHKWMKKYEKEFGMKMIDYIYVKKAKTTTSTNEESKDSRQPRSKEKNEPGPDLSKLENILHGNPSKSPELSKTPERTQSPYAKLFTGAQNESKTRSRSPNAGLNVYGNNGPPIIQPPSPNTQKKIFDAFPEVKQSPSSPINTSKQLSTTSPDRQKIPESTPLSPLGSKNNSFINSSLSQSQQIINQSSQQISQNNFNAQAIKPVEPIANMISNHSNTSMTVSPRHEKSPSRIFGEKLNASFANTSNDSFSPPIQEERKTRKASIFADNTPKLATEDLMTNKSRGVSPSGLNVSQQLERTTADRSPLGNSRVTSDKNPLTNMQQTLPLERKTADRSPLAQERTTSDKSLSKIFSSQQVEPGTFSKALNTNYSSNQQERTTADRNPLLKEKTTPDRSPVQSNQIKTNAAQPQTTLQEKVPNKAMATDIVDSIFAKAKSPRNMNQSSHMLEESSSLDSSYLDSSRMNESSILLDQILGKLEEPKKNEKPKVNATPSQVEVERTNKFSDQKFATPTDMTLTSKNPKLMENKPALTITTEITPEKRNLGPSTPTEKSNIPSKTTPNNQQQEKSQLTLQQLQMQQKELLEQQQKLQQQLMKESSAASPMQRNEKEKFVINPTTPTQQKKAPVDVTRQQSTSPIREQDFFVPGKGTQQFFAEKSPNINLKNRDASPDPNIFKDKEEDDIRMTRVTKLLNANTFKDIDNIISDRLVEKEPTGALTPNQNKARPDHSAERYSKISTGMPRVTNIDKYLETFEIDDTEENNIYNKIQNYYTNGDMNTPNKQREKTQSKFEDKSPSRFEAQSKTPTQNNVSPKDAQLQNSQRPITQTQSFAQPMKQELLVESPNKSREISPKENPKNIQSQIFAENPKQENYSQSTAQNLRQENVFEQNKQSSNVAFKNQQQPNSVSPKAQPQNVFFQSNQNSFEVRPDLSPGEKRILAQSNHSTDPFQQKISNKSQVQQNSQRVEQQQQNDMQYRKPNDNMKQQIQKSPQSLDTELNNNFQSPSKGPLEMSFQVQPKTSFGGVDFIDYSPDKYFNFNGKTPPQNVNELESFMEQDSDYQENPKPYRNESKSPQNMQKIQNQQIGKPILQNQHVPEMEEDDEDIAYQNAFGLRQPEVIQKNVQNQKSASSAFNENKNRSASPILEEQKIFKQAAQQPKIEPVKKTVMVESSQQTSIRPNEKPYYIPKEHWQDDSLMSEDLNDSISSNSKNFKLGKQEKISDSPKKELDKSNGLKNMPQKVNTNENTHNMSKSSSKTAKSNKDAAEVLDQSNDDDFVSSSKFKKRDINTKENSTSNEFKQPQSILKTKKKVTIIERLRSEQAEELEQEDEVENVQTKKHSRSHSNQENMRNPAPITSSKKNSPTKPGSKVNLEDQREKLLKNYKAKINKLSKLDGNNIEIDEEDEEIQYPEHSPEFGSNGKEGHKDYTKKYADVKSKMKFKSPEEAMAWYENAHPDKDLDYGFVPRDYVYNYKTIDDSYSDLRKKKRQLDNLLADSDWRDDEKVSRVSWRNNRGADKNKTKKEEPEGGIFDKVVSFLTCVGRDTKPPKRKNKYDDDD